VARRDHPDDRQLRLHARAEQARRSRVAVAHVVEGRRDERRRAARRSAFRGGTLGAFLAGLDRRLGVNVGAKRRALRRAPVRDGGRRVGAHGDRRRDLADARVGARRVRSRRDRLHVEPVGAARRPRRPGRAQQSRRSGRARRTGLGALRRRPRLDRIHPAHVPQRLRRGRSRARCSRWHAPPGAPCTSTR